jgi:hypothetical protein
MIAFGPPVSATPKAGHSFLRKRHCRVIITSEFPSITATIATSEAVRDVIAACIGLDGVLLFRSQPRPISALRSVSPTQPSMRLQPRHSLAKSFAGLHSAVARSDFAMRVLREMRGMLRGTEGMRYAVVL